MKKDFLAELLNEYLPNKPPMFISNVEILEFFKSRKNIIQYEDFVHIRDHFLITLGLSRYCFKTIESWFTNSEKPMENSPVNSEIPKASNCNNQQNPENQDENKTTPSGTRQIVFKSYKHKRSEDNPYSSDNAKNIKSTGIDSSESSKIQRRNNPSDDFDKSHDTVNSDFLKERYNDTSKNPDNEPVPPYFEKFREVMVLKRYSPKTLKSYLSAVRRSHQWFLAAKGVPIDEIDTSLAKEFFLMLIEEIGVSTSMVRIYRFAISFYFSTTLGRKIDFSFLEGMKSDRHLPTVLSRDDISRILALTRNTKHRTMIGLLYASGLRLSELIKLRVGDVDLEELTIHVKMGKGRKDRITIFSSSLVDGLRHCMEGKTADDYVFTPSIDYGAGTSRSLSGRTVQKVLEHAIERAGIRRKATPHDLRHAFATHLLENGISLRHIQMLLGHKNISTTTIYTKVAHPALKGIKSPL